MTCYSNAFGSFVRRQIAALYEQWLGIRVITAKQYVEDLREMLADLCDARDDIEAEIVHTSHRLSEAHQRLTKLQEQLK